MAKRVKEKIAVLKRLQIGDFVEATWIDASQSRGVNISRLPLQNHTIETRKVTSGLFVCVQRGKTWRDDHLILAFEETDGLHEVVSIPLSLVKIIRYSRNKKSRKYINQKKARQFADGSVKIFV